MTDRVINMHLTEELIDLAMGPLIGKTPSASIKFDINVLNKHQESPRLESQVELENTDTITAALAAVKAGYRPLILNMANQNTPGGGWKTGALAQEEHLFRCTNAFRTLTPALYPLHDEAIYSPVVHILRDADYRTLEKPVEISLVSVAAIQRPTLICGRMLTRDKETTERRVRLIYHIGTMGRHDCLILGALGCGAFYNPPEAIAKIFVGVTAEYSEYFKKIQFAIKCSPGNPNYAIFRDTFLYAFTEDPSPDLVERMREIEIQTEPPLWDDSVTWGAHDTEENWDIVEWGPDELYNFWGHTPTPSELDCFGIKEETSDDQLC